ncbi:MAG: hypothetical protein H6733_02755 [Alphaproteobacteria bacterium]|nr:hypothetical protein [Alphaproteobacteria bacterium]
MSARALGDRRAAWPARTFAPRRARRGLTVIELMLAITIVVVMAMVGWGSLQGAIEMNEALSEGDITTRSARAALGRMRRELQLAYLTPNRRLAGDPEAQTTIDPRFVTVFVAEDNDPDTLWFATLAHKRLYRNANESDQAEVTLWTERAPRDMGPGEILYHRESRRIDGEPDEGGRIWPLAYHVDTFNLRFLDSASFEWFDEWDTQNGEAGYVLPRAVQIGLVLLAPDPDDEGRSKEVPFVTTVMLEYADPVSPLSGNPLNPLAQDAVTQ